MYIEEKIATETTKQAGHKKESDLLSTNFKNCIYSPRNNANIMILIGGWPCPKT